MADFLFRILKPGERGGGGVGSRGGLSQHEKFSENFQKILNIFLACIKGGEGEGVSRKARRMQTKYWIIFEIFVILFLLA